MSDPRPCRVCGLPVTWRSGLSNRVHTACRAKEQAKRVVKQARAMPAYKLTRAVDRHGVTVPNADLSKGNHRDRKLLDLAHELHECTNCGRHAEAGCEPAHGNGIAAGKGFAIKSHDHRHAALDHACHAWLDQGTGIDPSGRFEGTREGKVAMWVAAHLRTFDEYWKRGWLKVAA